MENVISTEQVAYLPVGSIFRDNSNLSCTDVWVVIKNGYLRTASGVIHDHVDYVVLYTPGGTIVEGFDFLEDYPL